MNFVAMLSTVFTLLCVTLVIFGVFFYRFRSYWKKKGVTSKGNIIVGVFEKSLRMEKNIGECLKDEYFKNKFEKYYGTFFFTQPVLVIQDREIIRQILVKDYTNFASHGFYYNKNTDHLSAHLFNLAALDWKFMRKKLSPAFTSGKVKFMFSTVQECVTTFHKAVDKDRERLDNVININELLARLTTDIITSVAFGIGANSIESTESVFRKVGKVHNAPGWIKLLTFAIRTNYKLSSLLRLRSTSPEENKFFTEVFTKTVKYREKHNVRRNDFLDILIAIKNDDTKTGNDFYDQKITMKDIAAQSYLFFNAGYETSSSTMGFTFFELAKNPDIQRKVREECDRVMEACGGNVTFDAVQSMEYTEKVLQETLRLYPALCYLPRAVTKSCKLPTTDVCLEKDTTVWIPLLALHTDEEYFPNPYHYDPERFSEKNKRNILPYTYMPFGDGPRLCIGMRFALVQMKAVILEVISRYNLELPDEKRNMAMHPCAFVSVPRDVINLKVTPRVK